MPWNMLLYTACPQFKAMLLMKRVHETLLYYRVMKNYLSAYQAQKSEVVRNNPLAGYNVQMMSSLAETNVGKHSPLQTDIWTDYMALELQDPEGGGSIRSQTVESTVCYWTSQNRITKLHT